MLAKDVTLKIPISCGCLNSSAFLIVLCDNLERKPSILHAFDKRCLVANFELPSIQCHGWDENANICWIEESFPEDFKEILINEEFDENNEYDEEDEIGDECNLF